MVRCECHGNIYDNAASLQNHLALQAGQLTDRAVSAILDAVRLGEGPLRAARKAGVLPEVWQREFRTNKVLQNSLALAETEAAEQVEEALFGRATNGDYQSARFWLENRSESRWAPASVKVEVDVIHQLKELPPKDRLEKLAQMLSARPALANPEILDAEVIED